MCALEGVTLVCDRLRMRMHIVLAGWRGNWQPFPVDLSGGDGAGFSELSLEIPEASSLGQGNAAVLRTLIMLSLRKLFSRGR